MEESIQSVEGRLSERIEQTERRLSTELAGHAKALQESLSAQIATSVEPFLDLPGRVSRLETAVFGSEQR